ncbi:twin-arginine translocase TatA/TatE family subunit [Bdellovibrio bacteriovorus]|uniref:twin-arginine translocase TatA/TatE family subunit n=2 Tax=Bdellovibrio bacteriovorus TaxID=959 RepID=UPI00045C10C4|nr:preprotein translocase [Bdellovibrio bacteriovorus]BEV70161.1 Sec-independent protein translocase protein TatB [Bdellovibrio bacteriovorus]
MFGLGMSEIIFLAVLALIVIGPKELPELARTLGRFLNELKRSTDSMGDELKQQMRLDKLDKLDRLNMDTIRNPQQQAHQNEAEQAPLASAEAAPMVEEQLEFPQATTDEKSEEQKPS